MTGGVENETFAMEENDSVIAKEERDRRAPGFPRPRVGRGGGAQGGRPRSRGFGFGGGRPRGGWARRRGVGGGAAGSRVSAEAGAGAGASKETRWARAAEGDEAAFAGWVSLDEGGGCGSGVPAWWEALGFDHDETEAIAGEMLESLRRGAEEEGGGRG